MNRPQAYRLTVSSLLALLVMAALPATVVSQESTIAIVGATIIDGNGGAPVENGTIVVVGNRITNIGLSSLVDVPQGARVIDGSGKFVTPGFIDGNRITLGHELEDRCAESIPEFTSDSFAGRL